MTTGSSQSTPESASEDIISRSFVMEGDGKTAERQKKEMEIRGFTIHCDEREPMGDNTAPSPLAYFVSSLVF